MEDVSRYFCKQKDRKSKKQTGDIKGKMKREKKYSKETQAVQEEKTNYSFDISIKKVTADFNV